MSPILNGLAAERHQADGATDAMARFIDRQQDPDGHWVAPAYRPPLKYGDIQMTATAVRALKDYAPVPCAPGSTPTSRARPRG